MMEILDVQMPVGMGINIEVIEKMQKSRVARRQEKTKEELDLINDRVKHIFEDYELGESMHQHGSSNIEFMADIAELQAILGDAIKKSKYQHKVTIFIVGFQDVCLKRVQLLNEISEFFDTYSAPEEVDLGQDSIEELDIEAIDSNIQTALDTMDNAVIRLNDLNKDIVGYMNTMHSTLNSKSNKNRKKLEKNLALAKEDIVKMTEKLQIAQTELKAKEEQMLKLSKQLESKSKELVNFKTQLEKSKKNMNLVQSELNRAQLTHDDQINRAHSLVERLQSELQQLKNENAISYTAKIKEIADASLGEVREMKIRFSSSEEEQDEFRKEIALQYRVQTKQIEYIQSEELQNIQHDYIRRLSQILEIEVSEEEIQQWGKDDEDKDSNKQEVEIDDIKGGSPRMSTPGSGLENENIAASVSPGFTDDETNSPVMSPRKSDEKMMQPVDLTDEEYWELLPKNDISSGFAEYRAEAMKQINDLRSAAFQSSSNNNNDELRQKQKEERKKWKEEKITLLDHIQQLQKLQEEAEADADEAMRQLEEYANQQEKEIENLEAPESAEIRRAISLEDVHEPDEGTREQATSPPDDTKPLSSVSKQSVVSMVEEKRAAMLKRKESASRLLNSSSGKKMTTPTIQIMTDTDAYENFLKSYEAVSQFQRQIRDKITQIPNEARPKNLASGDMMYPDENETEEMASAVQITLKSMESVFESLISVANKKQTESHFANQQQPDHNDILHNRIAELEAEMGLMKSEYGRRVQHDSALIQHLQNTLSEMKQGNNLSGNVPMTTNTPSMSAPIASDHMLSVSQNVRGQTVDPNMTMMFTRLDSERNAKTLTKTAKSGKINQSTLDSLVITMEGYNEIAASRLTHLVQKMVHHTKMKEIELNVRNSNLVTSEVFDVLDKMEEIQRRRAQNWSRQMDELNLKRIRLGMLLQDAMQRLEKITGVFLIKPIISYKGKTRIRKYSGKISTRFNKYQMEAMNAKHELKNLNTKRLLDSDYMKIRASGPTYNFQPSTAGVPWTAQANTIKELEKDPLTVSGITRVEAPALWSMEMSLPQSVPITKKERWSPNYSSLPVTSVPRMVELDVGRFLHEINPIHTFNSPVSPLKSPRGIGGMRSYTGISRTIGTAGTNMSKMSSTRLPESRVSQPSNTIKTESSGDDYQSTAPPTTPASQAQYRRGSSGAELLTPNTDTNLRSLSSNLPRPLPPIQVPSKSRASTRSSFTGSSPVKEYFTPSPTKSISLSENASPIPGRESGRPEQEKEILEGNFPEPQIPQQQYIETAN